MSSWLLFVSNCLKEGGDTKDERRSSGTDCGQIESKQIHEVFVGFEVSSLFVML